MLVLRGATGIYSEYDKQQRVQAVSFKITFRDKPVSFRLPCKWEPILQILQNDPKVPSKLKVEEQAVRVAWRIVHAWVEAQMAIVDTEMAKIQEVFLPYVMVGGGQTLYDKFGSGQLLLGESKQ